MNITTRIMQNCWPWPRKVSKSMARASSSIATVFPSRALPYERQPDDAPRPQICIGADGFHTPKELAEELMQFFSGKGYSVALNVPFAGALTPLKLYRNESRLRSIMIEVRRDLYMDEQTGSILPTFDTIKQHVAEGIERIGGTRTLKARRTRV
jgi:N-formylglutamate amidohydrolase